MKMLLALPSHVRAQVGKVRYSDLPTAPSAFTSWHPNELDVYLQC